MTSEPNRTHPDKPMEEWTLSEIIAWMHHPHFGMTDLEKVLVVKVEAEIERLKRRVRQVFINEERVYRVLFAHVAKEVARLTKLVNTHDQRVPVEKLLYACFVQTLQIYASKARPSVLADRMADRLKQCVDEMTACIKAKNEEPAPNAPNHENRLTCSACGHEVDMLSHDKCASCLDDELAETTAKLHELQNAVLKHEKPAPNATPLGEPYLPLHPEVPTFPANPDACRAIARLGEGDEEKEVSTWFHQGSPRRVGDKPAPNARFWVLAIGDDGTLFAHDEHGTTLSQPKDIMAAINVLTDPCAGCEYKEGNRCNEPSGGDKYRFDKRNFPKLPCDKFKPAHYKTIRVFGVKLDCEHYSEGECHDEERDGSGEMCKDIDCQRKPLPAWKK
jgi:hypothetical protein